MKQKLQFFLSFLTLCLFTFLFVASNSSRNISTFQVTDLAPAITPDAKELTRITNDNLQEFGPAISPDSKKILYYSYDPMQIGTKGYHINVKTLGEQGTTPLLTEGCHSPAWMSDSKGFYFTYAVPTKPVIGKSKIDQGGINYVSPNANGDADDNASLLKAANKILFHTKIGGDYQIAMLDPNGLNFTLLGTLATVPKVHSIFLVKSLIKSLSLLELPKPWPITLLPLLDPLLDPPPLGLLAPF